MFQREATAQEIQSALSQINGVWQKIEENPADYLEAQSKIVYAAGGGLPLQFGEESSPIWQGLKAKAEGGNVTIAGVELTLNELVQLGDFYRFVKSKGYVLHCIDERLVESDEYHSCQVHEKCGACAAVQAAAGLEYSVEDKMLELLGEKKQGKQPVHPDMPEHVSTRILVDLSDKSVAVAVHQREVLKASKALPFHVSLPLPLLVAWRDERGHGQESVQKLIQTMVKWNVQIARNIIGGHNVLSALADKTEVVMYKNGSRPEPELEGAVLSQVEGVVPVVKRVTF